MKIEDNLHTSEEVRAKLASGIRKSADVAGCTMGTSGANVIIEAIESPQHYVTNDGATILSSIHFEDPIENIGKAILLEAVSRANKASGDGSSTTAVLTAAIIEEGTKYLKEYSPMDIKRSLEECIPLIEESINKQKRDITVDEVGQVASISAEDPEIGALIQEIYQKIGKDGIIQWDISKTTEDTYTIGQGITIEGAGYYSPYMCDADEAGNSTNQVKIKNPTILLTKQKIVSASDFSELFGTLNSKDIKDVIVFCDEVDPLVMPDLVKTRMVKGFRTILVKMPVLWKDQWYQDLALASGATVVDPVLGLSLRTTKVEHLGKFEHITVTKTDTFIDGMKDLSEYIAQLEEEGTDDSLLRASRLNTKTARLFVGAQSDSALAYKRLKVEDAISASWQALQNGIVAGGGSALVEASENLKDTIGGNILKNSLKSPAKQIAYNAGRPDMDIGNDYLNGMGFDTKLGIFVNMFDAGIIDPANIEINAAKNAISVAATVLTANAIITLPRDTQEQPNYPVQR